MNANEARDDLAYMRSLVADTEHSQRTFGETYLAAGLCYGVQMVLHGFQSLGWVSSERPVAPLISFGPTVVFVGLLMWILTQRRVPQAPTAVNRAVASVFGSVGLANLVLILLFGSIAWRQHSLLIWLIYPCVVMILQGMAWLVAASLRRRTWMSVVALGFFLTGVGMAFTLEIPPAYVAIAGVGMIAFMAVPGAVMMRQAHRSG
ncbi:hypothetical protein [Phenylobacterium sp.]|jgi:hypothetical protein|uniref:hypothetical protein n=1 Tax=Phenylobacterium sp. TaxID=1871053 RepID=UPI002E360D0E|nr:hypothetical protein [Phenylobacterium sp.]HEX4710699.1 hypothetical protein [Phenylobacterium sp.]